MRRRLPSALLLALLSLPGCALIDAMSGDTGDGGAGGDGPGGDGGAGADARDTSRCLSDNVCYALPVVASLPSGCGSSLVELGDFSGDAVLDLVVAGVGGSRVLWGDGGGTFTDGFPLGSLDVTGLAVGQFDGDSRVDLALSDADHGLIIHYASGDHSFTGLDSGMPSSSAVLRVLDFDGNGLDDILEVKSDRTVEVHRNDGAMGIAGSFSMDHFPPVLAVGHFLGPDTNDDLATLVGSQVEGFQSQGDGSFDLAGEPYNPDFGVGALARWRKWDQSVDWVAVVGDCNPCAGETLVEVGPAGVTPEGSTSVSFDQSFATVAVANGRFLNDQNEGLAILAGSGYVLLLDDFDEMHFRKQVFLSTGIENPEALATGDLNGDGRDDIVVTGSGYLSIILSAP